MSREGVVYYAGKMRDNSLQIVKNVEPSKLVRSSCSGCLCSQKRTPTPTNLTWGRSCANIAVSGGFLLCILCVASVCAFFLFVLFAALRVLLQCAFIQCTRLLFRVTKKKFLLVLVSAPKFWSIKKCCALAVGFEFFFFCCWTPHSSFGLFYHPLSSL